MKKQILLLALLALSGLLPAQTTDLSNLKKGRVSTTDGYDYRFSKAALNDSVFQFTPLNATAMKSVTTTKVGQIEIQTGTQSLKWAAYLGAAGLVGSLLGVAQPTPDINGEVPAGFKFKIVAGLTVGSALIGALIGASKPKYKTVYKNPRLGIGGLRQNLRFDVCYSGQGGASLGATLSF